MEHEQASRLTASQRDRVSQALQAARRNEQILTPQLRDIASRSGMGMKGPPDSVKSQGSLERKLGGELPVEGRGSLAHEREFTRQLDRANDVVRYTMVAPEGEYAAATNRAIRAMEDQGFVREFHTPESLAAKEVTHPIYDFSRVADPQMAPRFNELQNRVFDLVPLPVGTTRRGTRNGWTVAVLLDRAGPGRERLHQGVPDA